MQKGILDNIQNFIIDHYELNGGKIRCRNLIEIGEDNFNTLTELPDIDDKDMNSVMTQRSKARRLHLGEISPKFVFSDATDSNCIRGIPSIEFRKKILGIAYEKLRLYTLLLKFYSVLFIVYVIQIGNTLKIFSRLLRESLMVRLN